MKRLPACCIVDGTDLLPRIESGRISGEVVAKNVNAMAQCVHADRTP